MKIPKEFKVIVEEASTQHKWSCDCTCSEEIYSTCWYHLSDPEKASQSFEKGAHFGYEQGVSDVVKILMSDRDYILKHFEIEDEK